MNPADHVPVGHRAGELIGPSRRAGRSASVSCADVAPAPAARSPDRRLSDVVSGRPRGGLLFGARRLGIRVTNGTLPPIVAGDPVRRRRRRAVRRSTRVRARKPTRPRPQWLAAPPVGTGLIGSATAGRPGGGHRSRPGRRADFALVPCGSRCWTGRCTPRRRGRVAVGYPARVLRRRLSGHRRARRGSPARGALAVAASLCWAAGSLFARGRIPAPTPRRQRDAPDRRRDITSSGHLPR